MCTLNYPIHSIYCMCVCLCAAPSRLALCVYVGPTKEMSKLLDLILETYQVYKNLSSFPEIFLNLFSNLSKGVC